MKSLTIHKTKSLICIDLVVDGFLRRMARNIVVFLVKVDQGKISLKQAATILAGKIIHHNKSVLACGLYLVKVFY